MGRQNSHIHLWWAAIVPKLRTTGVEGIDRTGTRAPPDVHRVPVRPIPDPVGPVEVSPPINKYFCQVCPPTAKVSPVEVIPPLPPPKKLSESFKSSLD